MFRKMRGVHLPPDKQGYLFFLCRNYKDLPEETTERIDALCDALSKGEAAYRDALFDLLTSKKSVVAISMERAVGQTKLYELRRAYYEAWYRGAGGTLPAPDRERGGK